MANIDFTSWFDLKAVVFGVGGFVIAKLYAFAKGRVKVIEYTVTHHRLAEAAETSKQFGNIKLTWAGNDVANLWASELRFENHTATDLEKLRFRVYVGDAPLLLTEDTRILNTPDIVKFSAEYEAKLDVAAGATPSADQLYAYSHEREYEIPVLNRGQKVQLTFLTTIPVGTVSNGVWLKVDKAGYTAKHVPNGPRVYGAPAKWVRWIGLIWCLAVAATGALGGSPPWAIALSCVIGGMYMSHVGAAAFRFGKFAKRLVLAA